MLHPQYFRRIAAHGLGNPRSRVAHACALFEGCLYLGVTHPNGDGPQDCARILRYHFAEDRWEPVYQSPLIHPDHRAHARDVLRARRAPRKLHPDGVPRERGFRGMVVFQGRSDAKPTLYVSTISNWGGLILRSADGRNFEVVSAPGLGDDRLLSFRALIPLEGKLFTTPIGSVVGDTLDRNNTIRPTVFVSDDPANGVWRQASLDGMGDARNQVIFQMAAFGSWLYAGTGNPERGCELWKTDARGQPPYRWRKVLERGGYRYNLNESVTAMTPFGDALYVGTGLPGLGYDRAHDVGPAAAELLRIYPDDAWELVVGEPRFSPQGLQAPLSAMGPGFDDPYNSVFWRMAVYDGWLYVGTHQWQAYDSLLHQNEIPRGGFQLWATPDGQRWRPVTLDGLANPFAVGVRTLVPTPHGLVLGTDDHSLLKQRAQRRRNEPV
ncbi:MAG TPA: hypothetical protein P5330_03435, partial [Candidatus Competibacteraceae bacterium]|nr:hypothetical protein [Candidatus Competibacteraceae bacterium]